MKTKTNPLTTRTNSTRLTSDTARRAPIYLAALFCFALSISGSAEAKSRATQSQPQSAKVADYPGQIHAEQAATQVAAESRGTDSPVPNAITATTYAFTS